MIPWSQAFLTRSASGSFSSHFHSAWMLSAASVHTRVTRPDRNLLVVVAPDQRQIAALHRGESPPLREHVVLVPVEGAVADIMRGRSALACLRMGVVMRVSVLFIASFLSR